MSGPIDALPLNFGPLFYKLPGNHLEDLVDSYPPRQETHQPNSRYTKRGWGPTLVIPGGDLVARIHSYPGRSLTVP